MATRDRNLPRAVLALLPILVAGCTASPRSELHIGRDLTVVTYVTGDGCEAVRGTTGDTGGEQAGGGSVDPTAGVGAGNGEQSGTAQSLLASRVGCERAVP